MTQLIKDGIWNFPEMYTGDSFAKGGAAYQFKTVTDGLQAPSNSLANCRITFKKGAVDGDVQLAITSGSGITIDNAATWLITIDIFTIDWDPGEYYYDWETTDSSGIIETVQAGIVPIKQDTST